MQYTLGFIGAGNMAEAIAQAAIAGGIAAAGDMIAADPTPARRELFAALGIAVTDDNAAVITQSRHVLLAVKPQAMLATAGDLSKNLSDDQIVISIMAGVTTGKLAAAIGRAVRVVRVMPNTPMMVGCGMAGVARGAHAEPDDADLAMRLFSSGESQAIRVEESLLDAITAVSGSGPAYVFYLAEAMEKAAADLGLGEHGRMLVSQTILGAAKLLAASDESPADLRRKVTSPGGTTEAAVHHMDSNHLADTLVDAIAAAERRSRELGT